MPSVFTEGCHYVATVNTLVLLACKKVRVRKQVKYSLSFAL